MTATLITKNGRPNYVVIIRDKGESGKEVTRTISTGIPVKGNNKRKAEKMKDEILAQYMKDKIVLGNDTYFVGFMNQWLENLRHSIEGSTYEAYRMVFQSRITPYFEPKKLRVRDITPSHIQQFIQHCMETVSANTVRKYLANISKCLDSAVRQNIIAFNPVKRVDLPKKQKFIGAKFYNEQQIEQLLNCSKGDPLEIVILLTVFYGLRRSEVLGLKWDALDFTNGTMAIRHTVVHSYKIQHRKDSTKNDSSTAVVPLSRIIISRLKEWKLQQEQHRLLQPNNYIDEGYVCTQVDGSLIKPNYVTQHFTHLLRKHDMPRIRFHDLRHSSASYLKFLGFDLKDIQIWLRHADIQTSMNLYTHLDMTAKTEIAERLDSRIANFNS